MTVRRAIEVLPAGQWDASHTIDWVELDYEARFRRRVRCQGECGTVFVLDLPRVTLLNDGDGLKLDDNTVVAVRAAPESLVEVTAPDTHTLMRLAWHIGNRHLPAEIHANFIRLRDDHVINAMLEGLGGRLRPVIASFTPEGGAYDGNRTGHSHSHSHHHGHHHHHDREETADARG